MATEKKDDNNKDFEYLWGHGGTLRSEALPNAIPKGQSNPQRCPYDLYTEKLSGSAFTAPRVRNLQTWLYRIRPSVQHVPFVPASQFANPLLINNFEDPTKARADPNQMRWMPMSETAAKQNNFVTGLVTIAGSGNPCLYDGHAIHLYAFNTSMTDSCMINSDGDFLIVPQTGVLRVQTEMGWLRVEPCEIAVLPRGIRFAIHADGFARGYVLEVFNRHFTLPELGPIGSAGLANATDFCSPVAAFEDREVSFTIVNKFGGELFEATQAFSPFNVVGWIGTYAPFKYDLRKFMCINSVTYDHPDPSIYTVLTCQSEEPGVAVADFVIFPPRWMVMEHSFRPPWFHRNCMSEFMGMIWGSYDAKTSKQGGGFVPGGATLHNAMTPHGPDHDAFNKASTERLEPRFFDGGLAFMFESKFLAKVTPYALECDHRDKDYYKCWAELPKKFSNWLPSASDNLRAWREESKQ